MKKLFIIVLVFCLINGLNGSAADIHWNKLFPSLNQHVLPVADTIINEQIIRVDSFRLNIIPPASGIQFYGDGIIFLSQSRVETRMVPAHVSFGTVQAYYGLVNDSSATDRRLFLPFSSFPYPCDATTFNSDFTMMLYTMRTRNDATEKIWMARYRPLANRRDRWEFDDKPLSFCTGNYTYSHPALSSDGTILIFASDREDSIGEMDLYMTRMAGYTWMEPVNMGSFINTLGHEMHPFLDKDNNLYFSSNGRKGLGGFDIWMCRFDGKAWAYPVNLTSVINSYNDDIAFTIDREDGVSAFYTSRERSGRQNMQLYRVVLNPEKLTGGIKNLTQAFSSIAPPDKLMQERLTAILPEQAPLIAEKTEVKVERAAKQPETQPVQEKPVAEDAKKAATEETKPVEVPVIQPSVPEKKPLPEPVRKPEPAPVAKTEQPSITLTDARQVTPGVTYMIQFSASTRPAGKFQITVDGRNYTTYEYFYSGAYRSCAGEFNNLAGARALETAMRRAGFNQAFVVAFRNGERIVYYLNK
ncbi:MAG: hypothetical protein K0B05_03210 [Bacteroidales bacterium]|nr:hypothetical protein [Bacteroidales bacterium]